MMAVGKWGAFLQPSLKWSLLNLEKCVQTLKNRRDDGGAEGETTQQQNTGGQEELRGAEMWGEDRRWAGAQGIWGDFHALEHCRRGFL